ncbi:hypothetical protein F4810DRAFT_694159 [Camillea tinctor]|nr:hypothetical protein F4810DRAFT_694159 [Camillea tinctor]
MEMDMEQPDQPGQLGPPDTATVTAPLQPISPDRVNQQRETPIPFLSPSRSGESRDSDVHDKIRQFNSLAHLGRNGTANMTKQLERKTADAALKRAMMGREEAETEMRRYRDEARSLRKQIDEGRERERKVGERLETVMESYGRAKETYSHTQAIWEKEIRRARKETFKSQSSIVKLQEELKTARSTSKALEECLEREKELSKSREQEAFASRYHLAGLQDELAKALEKIKHVEEERDAFKAAAKSEEVARIAAEGRLPLPPEEPDSEFASPKRPREPLSAVDIVSSAASEAEIEELTRLWQWEKQRADRTQEHLEFVQAECELRCCPCAKSRSSRRSLRSSLRSSTRKERTGPIPIVDPSDLMILGEKPASREQSPQTEDRPQEAQPKTSVPEPTQAPIKKIERSQRPNEKREQRRSTIFVPSEGIFRTISQEQLEAMDTVDESIPRPPAHAHSQSVQSAHSTHSAHSAHSAHSIYSRTPSVEPPSFAMMVQERTSLLSLLNAPRESEAHSTLIDIPTVPDDSHAYRSEYERSQSGLDARVSQSCSEPEPSVPFYTVTTTTTVPIRDENVRSHTDPVPQSVSSHRAPSFDVNNPALIPTMTREEALAQIRERRGRARSAAQGAMTPRRQMVSGLGDRNVSAPAGHTTGNGRS